MLLFEVIERFSGVDLPCLENRAVVSCNFADAAADWCSQTVGYRVSGIGGQEKNLFAGFGLIEQEQSSGGRAGRFSNAAFAAEKEIWSAWNFTGRNGSHELTFVQCAVNHEGGIF